MNTQETAQIESNMTVVHNILNGIDELSVTANGGEDDLLVAA